MEMTPALAFVGKSGSGKTTLMVRCIEELTARGHRVGAIKHHTRRDFEIDHEGKDSYRFSKAGSVHTVIAAPTKVASIREVEGEYEFADLVRDMPDLDVVLVEGYRMGGLPTVEVIRTEVEKPEALSARKETATDEVIAIASDYSAGDLAPYSDAPVFELDDVSGICDLIECSLGL